MSEPRSVLALAVLLAASPVGAAPPPAVPTSKVALTFDDLPVHGPVPKGRTRVEVIRDTLDALRAAKAPAVFGFINAGRGGGTPENDEILRMWRAAGYPLGIHSHTHMSLHDNPVEAFEKDVLANEPTLRALMGSEDWHWFRFPYLRSGETIEKRRAASAMLRRHGYRVAEVTLDFADWAYHGPYARCVERGDQAGIEWLKKSYLDGAAASLASGREEAQRLYGRDIHHVMLLHVGGLNAVMMPALLRLLRDEGFALVSLPEAQSDAAYAVEPDIALPTGSTLLDQMTALKKLPRAARAGTPMARLAEICK
jgi:peptidoglycan-N-acetylglucosamine deacetylase